MKTLRYLSHIFVLKENPNQSLQNAFSPPFHTQPVKRGAKCDYLTTSVYKLLPTY